MLSDDIHLKQLLREYETLPEFQGSTITSVNQHGGFRSTPLHIAIYRDNLSEVKLLLSANANPNAPGEYGERPLQVALNVENDAIIELLLRAGANCELTDEGGMNAWHVAEISGKSHRFKELIKRNKK